MVRCGGRGYEAMWKCEVAAVLFLVLRSARPTDSLGIHRYAWRERRWPDVALRGGFGAPLCAPGGPAPELSYRVGPVSGRASRGQLPLSFPRLAGGTVARRLLRGAPCGVLFWGALVERSFGGRSRCAVLDASIPASAARAVAAATQNLPLWWEGRRHLVPVPA